MSIQFGCMGATDIKWDSEGMPVEEVSGEQCGNLGKRFWGTPE